MRLFVAIALGFILIVPFAGCEEQAIDDPIIKVEDDDPEMAAAEAKARETVQQLIDAVLDPAPRMNASVKMRFEDGEQVEYMWLTKLSYSDGLIHGTLNNEPAFVRNVKIGDKCSVKPEEINDWMIVDNGTITGGYTVKVLMKRQSGK